MRDLRPILNPHPQYFLNPQSLILNPQSSILILIIILNTSSILILNPQYSSSILNCLSSIPAPKSQQKCGILDPKCPQKCVILGKMSAHIACSFFQLCWRCDLNIQFQNDYIFKAWHYITTYIYLKIIINTVQQVNKLSQHLHWMFTIEEGQTRKFLT